MRFGDRRWVIGLVGAWLGFLAAPASADYTLIDLGTLPSGSQSKGFAINGQGQVTGEAETGLGLTHAFRWDGSPPLKDLGTLPGGEFSSGRAINLIGQVAGKSQVAIGAGLFTHAFVSSADGKTLTDLGTLGGLSSEANGINGQGVVVGTSQTADGTMRAFRGTGPNNLQDLGSLVTGGTSQGNGINDVGHVVGTSQVASGGSRAFLYTDADGMKDLGSLIANGSSSGFAINSKDQVTGASDTASGFSHAFLYTQGSGMVDIADPLIRGSSVGLGINDAGLVVGRIDLMQGGSRAFLWSPLGGMVDLNDLIDPSLGWTLTSATGINNAGQITGMGTINGRVHAFVLTPGSVVVPAPPSLVLLGVGGLAVAGWNRLRGRGFERQKRRLCMDPHLDDRRK